MHEFVMDTETTGLDPASGDRLVEIACVELSNHIPTGRVYHEYINPQRDMPEDAFKVHGLSTRFLSDKPLFSDIAPSLLDFVKGGLLIFHNASFDMKFINSELLRSGHKIIPSERVFDTLALARRKHPAGPNSLDALCKRYGVDNTTRTIHGALLDAELLAAVYLHLIGGRQAALNLSSRGSDVLKNGGQKQGVLIRPRSLPANIDLAEIDAHEKFIAELGQQAIWQQYR